ncbi:hypothetical protein [Acidocella sp.]|uniref:hypothetical protein n=1 Tax=Acidocella sp. TaxID=50710 RepID=UPI002639EBB2|nr:hypothetical protein [Acidocella sp.]MDD2795894.1 hypothetical protein [Acidocella sp.]
MIVPKDDTGYTATGHDWPVEDVAAVAGQFLVMGAGRYSGRVGKWHLPVRSGVNRKLHRIFFKDKQARGLQSVPMAPKRSFTFRLGMSEAPRIQGELKNTFWLAGSAGERFSMPGLRAGWGKQSSWLGGGHVLPGRGKHLAGLHMLLTKNENATISHLRIKPGGRVGNVGPFAPVSVVAPFRMSGQESRLGRSVRQENMRVHPAGPPRLYSQELASTGYGLKKNRDISEYVTGSDQGSVAQEPRKRMADISRAMGDYFMHQARLPPSGAMAFDPRLTPAWAGLKLPV